MRLQEVGLSILQRSDFRLVNSLAGESSRYGAGATALHIAAAQGLLELTRAIVQHRGFKQLCAKLQGDGFLLFPRRGWVKLTKGSTASQLAREQGHHQISELLDALVSSRTGAAEVCSQAV